MNIVPEVKVEEATRMEQVAKKQKEYHLIGKQRKVRGHILFEFDKTTKKIRQADVKRTAQLKMDGTTHFETRTDIKEGCCYLQALNVKNAEKKLRKIGLL